MTVIYHLETSRLSVSAVYLRVTYIGAEPRNEILIKS